MAALPPITRILREDIKEAPSWIERLLYPINTFFESVYAALNKQLTFDDNIRSQIREITFTTTAAYDGTAANFTTLTFPRGIPVKAKGLLLLQIVKQAGYHTPIESAVRADWLEQDGTIEIYTITGLAASATYTARFLLI